MLDGFLLAKCLSDIMNLQSWASIGAVNHYMKSILLWNPYIWNNIPVDLSKMAIKEEHCVFLRNILKHAKAVIISGDQVAVFRRFQGNYRMRWNARMPYCNTWSRRIYRVRMHGFQEVFVSELPMTRGIPYYVEIHWVGSLPCFWLGITECSNTRSILNGLMGLTSWTHFSNFITVGVHTGSQYPCPLLWKVNGIEMKHVDSESTDVTNNVATSADRNINQLCVGIKWDTDSVDFWWNHYYKDTLHIVLPKSPQFYFFLNACASSHAIARIYPKDTNIKVSAI